MDKNFSNQTKNNILPSKNWKKYKDNKLEIFYER